MTDPVKVDPRPPWLVIAIGNASRGDDALGPLVAARLREAGWCEHAGVEIREGFQLQVEDVLALDGRAGVLFVDATVEDVEAPVGCRPLAPAAATAATAFTHALAPAVLLALFARVLGRPGPPAWQLALPARSFALGAPLSAAGAKRLAQGVEAAQGWLRARAATLPAIAALAATTALPVLLAGAPGAAGAQPLPRDERERACWLSSTRERTRVKLGDPTAVDFALLRDGWTVRTPLQVDFAIRGMGVIPAGKPHPKAGHHHMLVDTPLPVRVGDPIPFSDFHRHYGKGQTGATIALAPGKRRLRLLFADHDHRPYFVFSPEITINVVGPRDGPPPRIDPANFAATCALWLQDELTRPRPEGQRVLITNLREGEPLASPFNVRFAVDGFGVAPRGHGGPGLGHFDLEVLGADGRVLQRIDLEGGATQAVLALPTGAYTLRLRFVDDEGKPLLSPANVPVAVTSVERL
jgi:hydrogenase maturation protease